MTKLKFALKSAGYCTANQSHALRGAPNKTIKFFATYGHIVHPIHGHILFDTGYTRRFYTSTLKYPYKIYAKATKVFIEEHEEALTALKHEGIAPEDIKFIIISHFHADHIGGLKDFPNAQFICSKAAYEDIVLRKGLSAVKKGFLPNLLPENFESRTRFLSFEETSLIDPHLGNLIDLFEDRSIQLCALDGHAKGQIGALLQSERPIFLIADAAWFKANYQQLHLPSPIVRLFFDSWSDFIHSLKKIHTFHKANPETQIIPCHCEETYREWNNNNV